jgi:predicted transcriptional regulator of viral defense system
VNQIEALRRLRQLGAPVFETRDASALLQVTPANANMILRRLADHDLITHLTRGRWLMDASLPRFALPELISAPHPAYVSMQSALFHRGLIEQVPAVIYAATLGKPRRVNTPVGTISFHRLPAELFLGYELEPDGSKIATAEKALFDTLYLAPARSRLFASLPELEIPRDFRWRQLRELAALVKFPRRRVHIERRIEQLERQWAPRAAEAPRRTRRPQ